MQEIIVRENESGQRLDKLLAKYLNLAPKSFFYKMLRKKNITLNGKKADGSERLSVGDSVKLFLSDETIQNFSQKKEIRTGIGKLPVLYEDRHIILINKPSGMLSQKAAENDVSAVELLLSYLIENHSLTEEDLKSFTPSVCNRLDRNTSGILIAGKSLTGLQVMSQLLKERTLGKYYLCIVAGELKESCLIKGYLVKNKNENFVTITENREGEESLPIETYYEPLLSNKKITLLKVKLVTGRSHQIRAHLASMNHPIIGDFKYGNEKINRCYRDKYRVKNQLLHAYELKFPELLGELSYLSKKQFQAPCPKEFHEVLKGEGLCFKEDLMAKKFC